MSAMAILTYHSIDPTGSVISLGAETFERQVECLSQAGFRGISLRGALAERDELGCWPERTVAMTFDDGYRNNHRVALPILARHGFTATCYVITGSVGADNDWAPPPPGLGRQPMLDWDEIAALDAAGWEIGGHSRTHPDLRTLAPGSIEDEVLGSCRDIDERLGGRVETFAYPYGHASGAAETVVARELLAGCTTVLRRVSDESPARLPRVDMYYVRDSATLLRLVDGHLDAYLTVRRWGRWLRASISLGDR